MSTTHQSSSTQSTNHTEDNNNNLEHQLEQAHTQHKKKEIEEQNNVLQKEITQLTRKLEEAEQIAKRAQSDYIHLKFDFDAYMTRNEEHSKTAKIDTLIEVVKKFLPFIEGLRHSLVNIPETEKNDTIVQGVQMVYDKFISTLEQMNIYKIESIGKDPDINLHEAVSALPVDNSKQKGKIIQEFEQGFIYEKGDIRKVVTAAKVVVGQ